MRKEKQDNNLKKAFAKEIRKLMKMQEREEKLRFAEAAKS